MRRLCEKSNIYLYIVDLSLQGIVTSGCQLNTRLRDISLRATRLMLTEYRFVDSSENAS